MKEDKRITQKDVEDAEVRLRPILGIAPSRYLVFIYLFAVLAVLFMVFLFPGLKHPGSYYRVVSDPPGSAILVDGAYLASTPATVFLAAGERNIRIEHPQFLPKDQSLRVHPRLLGTLSFRKERQLDIRLSAAEDAETILVRGMKEYSWWALTGQPSEAYQIPMVLSDAARAWTGLPSSLRIAPKTEFAAAALSYASHPQSFRDAVRAAILVSGESATLTVATLGRTASLLTELLASEPALLAALASALPPDAKSSLESSTYYTRLSDAALRSVSSIPDHPPAGRRVVDGMEFIEFAPGNTVLSVNSTLSAVLGYGKFALAAAETTVGQFREFLSAQPQWSATEAEALREAGLVDTSYLKDLETAEDDQPVRYVSRAAAEAYASWLDSRAPAGYRFSLPTEAQWNRAAAASAIAASRPDAAALYTQGRTGPSPVQALRTDAAGFRGLLGSVWEWCADSYAVHPGLGSAGRRTYPAYDGLVRGGSWANRADLVNIDSRGSMAPESCNAYTGFRLALVPVED